ncbi:sigma-70 family RNA polymerase sigma factor [Dyella mobilis]|uniref:Sigma-70 family RNA polymerase sigma factor n=1 Tax=Dyella mobilis TaxID=1849582 RepID=A0ABS2KHG6_9GAMM|nr:sigma-70 family RNA polymerase sigma factor [Dyella mobilis]MBM7130605.1 sigma-70 family RNA polymerase sigma factor [Dyella mobilis]GLQ97232.1 Ecf-type RNA polymerase sigma factor [Dyella mobilis]
MIYLQTMPGGWIQACARAKQLVQAQLSWQDRAPVSAAITDEACMARYQQGDATAFQVLYTRYRDRLHRYTLRLATRSSEAEEVFQEVWLAVIRSRDNYRPTSSFAAWLFSIAHRRAADRWRSLGRHAPDSRESVSEDEITPAEQHALAVHETPEYHAHNERLRHALLEAVQQLPLPQREAFLLRAEGDLSLDDIAAVTGVTRETAKSRLRYAQRRLREALETWR